MLFPQKGITFVMEGILDRMNNEKLTLDEAERLAIYERHGDIPIKSSD